MPRSQISMDDLKILLVDDNLETVHLIRHMLTDLVYTKFLPREMDSKLWISWAQLTVTTW